MSIERKYAANYIAYIFSDTSKDIKGFNLLEVVSAATVEYTVAALLRDMMQHLYDVPAVIPFTVPLVVVLATSTAVVVPTLLA